MEAFFSEGGQSFQDWTVSSTQAYEGGHDLQVLVGMTQVRYMANPAKRSSLCPRTRLGDPCPTPSGKTVRLSLPGSTARGRKVFPSVQVDHQPVGVVLLVKKSRRIENDCLLEIVW
jgi:hypothetical protein